MFYVEIGFDCLFLNVFYGALKLRIYKNSDQMYLLFHPTVLSVTIWPLNNSKAQTNYDLWFQAIFNNNLIIQHKNY